MGHTYYNDEVLQAEKGDDETQQRSTFNNSLPRAAATVILKFYKIDGDGQ